MKLLNTYYRGDNQRFNCKKYINVHKEAHKLLEDSWYNEGQGIDKSTKCHHFISGIKEQAGLEYALSTACSNSTYRQFTSLTSFLTAEVDHCNMRKKQLKSNDKRNVLDVCSENTNNGGQENQNKKQLKFKWVDGKKIFNKIYPKDEFHKMSKAQKDTVIQKHKASKKKQDEKKSRQASSISKDNIILLGKAIVAGVA